MRRTKIVASLGPATDDPEVLRTMIRAGVDVVRINLSHGSIDDGMVRYDAVRKIAAEEQHPVGILADLPGPKVRTAVFKTEAVFEIDNTVTLAVGDAESTGKTIEIDYEALPTSFLTGERIIIGDGRLVLEVVGTSADQLSTKVVNEGSLTGSPGVHIPADKLTMPTPTPRDLVILDAFVEAGVDMVAVSFVRSAHDMRRVGTEPHPRGPLLVAKIETRAAVDNLEGIIEASGAIMVARGDLGNELPIEDLPITQKKINHRALHRRGQACDHRNPDARKHDYRSGPNTRRGVRCRQRCLGWHERRHALGRDSRWRRPGERRSYDGRSQRLGTQPCGAPHDRVRQQHRSDRRHDRRCMACVSRARRGGDSLHLWLGLYRASDGTVPARVRWRGSGPKPRSSG